MVLLTITPAILRALQQASTLDDAPFPPETYAQATLGGPISHTHVIELARVLKQHPQLQQHKQPPTSLASLLHSTTLYIAPPPPKPTPSPAYTALMVRLRRDYEAQSYARMLRPAPALGGDAHAHALASTVADDEADDEVSYEEVHRQIILIINVLVSVVAVAIFAWVAARHWSVGMRLGLSLGGGLGIAVAEVAVYAGYVRKVREAKRVERKKPEIKEVVTTWVVDKGQRDTDHGFELRSRKGKHR